MAMTWWVTEWDATRIHCDINPCSFSGKLSLSWWPNDDATFIYFLTRAKLYHNRHLTPLHMKCWLWNTQGDDTFHNNFWGRMMRIPFCLNLEHHILSGISRSSWMTCFYSLGTKSNHAPSYCISVYRRFRRRNATRTGFCISISNWLDITSIVKVS